MHTVTLNMARRAAGVAVMLGGLALLAGCQTVRTTQGGVVGVDRQQTMLVSSDTINRSAAQEYQKVIAEAQRKNALDRDAQQAERVRRIAERLIPTTAVFRSDAPGWRWEVHVLSSNEVNAWCMPGGKIAVYTGLISKLNITDDELAAVMGHEIAHALREHGREQYSKAVAQQVGLSVVGVLLGAGQAATDLSQRPSTCSSTCPSHARMKPRRIALAWNSPRVRDSIRGRRLYCGRRCRALAGASRRRYCLHTPRVPRGSRTCRSMRNGYCRCTRRRGGVSPGPPPVVRGSG